MNRFFRTAYSTTLVYLCLTLFGVLITSVKIPFLAFSCLYFGLLIFLLPGMSQRLIGKERLFYVAGAMTAVLGFLPIALWRCPMIHWLIHLSGIASAAVFLSILRHKTTHRLFLAKFEFTAVSLFILIGLVFLAIRTVIYQSGQASERYAAFRLAMNGIAPYAIVLLASGVLLLRGLRAQPGRAIDEQAFNRRQLRDTLIFAILVTLVFAADPFVYLGKAVSFLINEVLRPSSRFLARLLVSLLKSMSFRNQPAEDSPSTEEAANLKPVPAAEFAQAQTEQNYIEENDLTPIFDSVCLAVLMLILLVILASQIRKLVRILRKRSRDRWSGYPNETCETLPMKDGMSREGKPKRRNSNPRERIRYLYGEFLRYLHKSRVQFDDASTCGEIQHSAEKQSVANPSMLSELTALYEEARYRMQEMPTEADARVMKDLLDRIKKDRR